MAKIHTVEWTTGILGHPALQIGMRANWWGLAGERITGSSGGSSASEVISGIVGSARPTTSACPTRSPRSSSPSTGCTRSIPDDYAFRSVARRRAARRSGTFREIAGRDALEVLERSRWPTSSTRSASPTPARSRCTTSRATCRTYERQDGVLQDLAATDILRIRELGVPRYNAFRQLLHMQPCAASRS